MSVTEYTARFVELAKFYPHYSEATAEFSKCVKFENGLRPEIKQAVGYQRIRRFSDLTDCCRIYEEDSKARSAHYKSVNERKGKHPYRGEHYVIPADKGKHEIVEGKRPSGGGAPNPPICFKCGGLGHRSFECRTDVKKCLKCGKVGHVTADCTDRETTCFKCGEPGHISPYCQKLKQTQAGGKAFALTGSQPSSANHLDEGICFINGIPCFW